MVITHVSQIDGHAQPLVIEGQDSQDPDEPPIPRPPPVLEKLGKESERTTIRPGFDSIIGESKDGSITSAWSWDGNADTAHSVDSKGVTTFLEVDPMYVCN
jgi:hypothetical protein